MRFNLLGKADSVFLTILIWLFCNWNPANTNDFFINTSCKKPKILFVTQPQFLINFSAGKGADVDILLHQKNVNLCLPHWFSLPFINFFLVLCILTLLSSHAAQLFFSFHFAFPSKFICMHGILITFSHILSPMCCTAQVVHTEEINLGLFQV